MIYLSQAEKEDFGYFWEGMTCTKDIPTIEKWLEEGLEMYAIYPDNTEGSLEEKDRNIAVITKEYLHRDCIMGRENELGFAFNNMKDNTYKENSFQIGVRVGLPLITDEENDSVIGVIYPVGQGVLYPFSLYEHPVEVIVGKKQSLARLREKYDETLAELTSWYPLFEISHYFSEENGEFSILYTVDNQVIDEHMKLNFTDFPEGFSFKDFLENRKDDK